MLLARTGTFGSGATEESLQVAIAGANRKTAGAVVSLVGEQVSIAGLNRRTAGLVSVTTPTSLQVSGVNRRTFGDISVATTNFVQISGSNRRTSGAVTVSPPSSVQVSGVNRRTMGGLTVYQETLIQVVGVNRRTTSAMVVSVTEAISPDILWLEADYGVTESSGAVSAWADRSTNAYSFAQATSGNRPLLVTGVVNGHPVIRFDGSNDTLSITTTLLNTSGSNASIFVVADRNGGSTGAMISTRSNITNTGFTLRYNSATEILYFHTGSSPNIARTITDKFNLFEVERTGLSIRTGLNGGSLSSATTLGGYTVSSTGTWIGSEQEGTGSSLNGDIAAIIISTVERTEIIAYLVDKYGIS
jgi:hypothetical protein